MTNAEPLPVDPTAITDEQNVVEQALQRLFAVGWERNAGHLVITSRHWPAGAAIDTLIVVNLGFARAQRDTPTKEMAMLASGALDEVIDTVLAWPAPDAIDQVEPLSEQSKDLS